MKVWTVFNLSIRDFIRKIYTFFAQRILPVHGNITFSCDSISKCTVKSIRNTLSFLVKLDNFCILHNDSKINFSTFDGAEVAGEFEYYYWRETSVAKLTNEIKLLQKFIHSIVRIEYCLKLSIKQENTFPTKCRKTFQWCKYSTIQCITPKLFGWWLWYMENISIYSNSILFAKLHVHCIVLCCLGEPVTSTIKLDFPSLQINKFSFCVLENLNSTSITQC